MLKTSAFQIADAINIKEFKKSYVGNLYYYDSDELFYEAENEKYIYIFEYGAVCFFGYDEIEITKLLSILAEFCEYPLEEKIREDFELEISENEQLKAYNKITVKELNGDVLRLIMLNVSQSVALDYFSNLAEDLLKETKKYTLELENYGNLNIKGIELKKFIGKSLNLKNRISQNLYIFDSHPETWENEYLNRIDYNMKKTFDVFNRSNNLKEEIGIIKENLDLFVDLIHHKKSSFLEWIIIILILVEVVNMLIEKFLH